MGDVTPRLKNRISRDFPGSAEKSSTASGSCLPATALLARNG